jgi:hypothetical protein
MIVACVGKEDTCDARLKSMEFSELKERGGPPPDLALHI